MVSLTQTINMPTTDPDALAKRWYADIKEDRNNFSFWFPKIAGCGIKVPKSVVMEVPMEMCQHFYMDEPDKDMDAIHDWVERNAMSKIREAFNRFPIFVKNGTFSNKFSYANCVPSNTVDGIAQAMVNINYDSLLLGAGGQAELVVRERLGMQDLQSTYRIYGGLPLRPEFRVFYDFDRHQLLYTAEYWDWGYCHKSITRDRTDGLVYEAAYQDLHEAYTAMLPEVEALVRENLAGVTGLSGRWSVDVMYVEQEFYLIDMALAQQSAYYDPQRISS